MYKVQYKCALYGECTLILHLVYVLHWPDDGCFTAETCSPDVNWYFITMRMYICCVLDGNINIILILFSNISTKMINSADIFI